MLSLGSFRAFVFCLWAFGALIQLAGGDLSLQEQVGLAGKLVYSTIVAVDMAMVTVSHSHINMH